MARTTIKNDPFATVIPALGDDREQQDGTNPLQRATGARRQKVTVHLRVDLAERLKNAAYWNPRLTIAAIAEEGILQALERVERENGGPYPRRES